MAQNAVRYGDRTCIVDERGTVSFAELHRRTNALANAFADRGLGPGRPVGLLARDSRWFVETVVACSKLGADLVLLNTGFSAPQLSAVLDREGVAAIVHDEEFAAVAAEAGGPRPRYVAWSDGGDGDAPLLDELIAGSSRRRAGRAGRAGAADRPDVGDDRHAEGRTPAARRAHRRGRRVPRSRPRAHRAARTSSSRRSSTSGASPTWGSGSCSARA